jgi:ligand-binding sensor domain-containing protein
MLALGLLLMSAPAAVHTSTLYVEDLAADADTVWAATRGGLEAYDRSTLARREVATTQQGLAASATRRVIVEGGTVVVETETAACARGAGGRFTCHSIPPSPPAVPGSEELEGARVTARLRLDGRELVGTAGRGLWLVEPGLSRRITPGGQIGSNHVMAIVEHRGSVFLGSFDEGLSRWDGRAFERVALPARMINDLAATPAGLHVATSEGLWRSEDGRRFVRVAGVNERGINDLAYDAATDTLYATAPSVLYRIRADGVRAFWRPGGTRALQAVEVGSHGVWLAAEDRGALRFRGGRAEIFDRAAGLPSSWALDVAVTADGGALVATLRDGLVRVAANGRWSAVAGLPDAWILHVSADAAESGAFFVGTQDGASRIDPHGRVRDFGRLPDGRVHAIARIGDAIWVATESGTAVYRE